MRRTTMEKHPLSRLYSSSRLSCVRPAREVLACLACSLLVVMAAACGSTSVSVDSPSTLKCQVTTSNSMELAPAAGVSGTLTVSTTRDCSWSATSGAVWIVITSENTGQGNGSVAYRVAENTDPAPRRGAVTVNDVQTAIAQEGAPCRFTIAAPSTAIPAGGGTATITVTASAGGCAWTASSQTEWIQVTGGSTGTGNGSVTLSTAANVGAARSGTVTVGGQVVTLSQAGVTSSCDAVLTPLAQTLDASGGGEFCRSPATVCRRPP